MAEYAATTLSLTPVAGAWREVMSRISQYLTQQHEPYPVSPREPTSVTVHAEKRRIVQIRPYNGSSTPPDGDPRKLEQWQSVSVELDFGSHRDLVTIRLRDAGGAETDVELWFPTAVHESVFAFDSEERDFAPEAKADLIRLCVGLSGELQAAGFAYRYADEDHVFGPPKMKVLRDYVEKGDRWFGHQVRLLVAGVAASQMEPTNFEYDMQEAPLHYRQSGYYLCDRLWPRS